MTYPISQGYELIDEFASPVRKPALSPIPIGN